MELTKNQKYYFDKIHSRALSELLKVSFTFFSMPEEKKMEFLIFLSQVHLDKKAEAEVIDHLKNEKKETIKLAKETQKSKLTKEDANDIVKAINDEYIEMKNDVETLKKTVRTEQEKDQKKLEQNKLSKLLTKLDQT